MLKNFYALFFLLAITFFACKEKAAEAPKQPSTIVSEDGARVELRQEESQRFFKTEAVHPSSITADIVTLAKIAVTVISSGEDSAQHNIALFENPEYESSYTQFLQHRSNISLIEHINIEKKKLELLRIRDLYENGAASGQDLLNAEAALSMEKTNLANEKASLIEHKAKLISVGLAPETIMQSSPGTAYVIADVPENQLSKIKIGNTCRIQFTAFPNQFFTGKIRAIAEVLDNITRMVKVRISIDNKSDNLKSGMFGYVSFGVHEGKFISIRNKSLLTVQGRHYAFVRIGKGIFERRVLRIGQQIGDRVVVFSGLQDGDEVVIGGIMQLKGLSFGY